MGINGIATTVNATSKGNQIGMATNIKTDLNNGFNFFSSIPAVGVRCNEWLNRFLIFYPLDHGYQC